MDKTLIVIAKQINVQISQEIKTMAIKISIIEVLHNDDKRGRGEFEFSHIPANGDQIVIPSGMGDLDIMKVLYVEHSPVSLPRKFYNEDKQPTISLYVECIGEYDGK